MTVSSKTASVAPVCPPTEGEAPPPWRDMQLERWLDATQRPATIEIVLENLAARSWVRSLLATLGSQHGTRQYRFVARENDATLGPVDHAVSGTFPVPPLQLPVDRLHAGDAWGDEAADRLEELEQVLREQGWQPTAQGEYWWSKIFTRPPPRVAAS